MRLKPPIPPKKLAQITWDSEPEARRRLLNSDFCGLCAKALFRTKADARSYIGLLLSKPGRMPRPKDSTFQPYRCPHQKGWHVGSSGKVAQLLRTKL